MKVLLATFLLLSSLTAYSAQGPEPTLEGAVNAGIAFSAPMRFAQFAQGDDGIPDFNGVWIAAGGRRGRPPGGTRPQTTAEARRLMQGYDLLVDDPGYECSPASILRAWVNPTPTEIEQQEDRVILRHEYMDVVRSVDLSRRDHATDAQPRVVGHSIGWYGGSTLVIDTTGFSRSIIQTVSGLPQTETLRTVERLTLSDDGQTFQLELTHEDPATFTAPWTSTRTYRRASEFTLLEFDCVLEDAGYEQLARE